jgi:hypothetical protein
MALPPLGYACRLDKRNNHARFSAYRAANVKVVQHYFAEDGLDELTGPGLD